MRDVLDIAAAGKFRPCMNIHHKFVLAKLTRKLDQLLKREVAIKNDYIIPIGQKINIPAIASKWIVVNQVHDLSFRTR